MTTLPLHRRLGVRLGLVLFIGLFAFDIVLIPAWNVLYYAMAPQWSDPAAIRAYADRLEAMTPAEAEAVERDAIFLDESDNLVVVASVALYAAIVALLLGSVVSFLASRRVALLTRQAATSAEGGDVPGPFHEEGDDEIAVLGMTMNRMRGEILHLLASREHLDRERRRWITEVSHDLRTPLTALAVTLDEARAAAERPSAEHDQANLKSSLDLARDDLRRVQDFADDLLEIARLDAGQELTREMALPIEMLRDVMRELQPLAQREAIELRLDAAPDAPEVYVDGRAMMRALENLVLNSIQHARGEVVLRASVDQDSVRIGVLDDGPGLPTENGTIRLGSLRQGRRRKDSTGIGLEVVDRVVTAHEGTLTVRNRSQGGASVEMVLPRRFPT